VEEVNEDENLYHSMDQEENGNLYRNEMLDQLLQSRWLDKWQEIIQARKANNHHTSTHLPSFLSTHKEDPYLQKEREVN
jgi:hypothetical protein